MKARGTNRLRLKCDGTRAETRFRLSAKRTSPFKSAGGVSSVDYWQPRCAASGGSNAVYTMFRGSVKSTGYQLHSPVSPSIPLPCVVTFQLDSTTVFIPVEVCVNELLVIPIIILLFALSSRRR